MLYRVHTSGIKTVPAPADVLVEAELDKNEAYAAERVRLLHPTKSDAEKDRLRREVADAWPFAPELLTLLEDHILMADSAQDKRDLIRIMAELYLSRGTSVPLLTPSDFFVDDDDCGVLTLIDSFATTADQERLREKAIRNLEALKAAGVQTEHAREAVSGIWIRSLSATKCPRRNAGRTPTRSHTGRRDRRQLVHR